MSSLEKEYYQFSSDSRPELGALKKSIKSKEKEIYILSTKFANSHDTNANLKSEMSSLKIEKSKVEKVKTLDLKIKKLDLKKTQQQFVSTQTYSTIDVPDLSQVSCVTTTDEDIVREMADEALDYLYDRGIATFYEAGYKEACERKGKDVALKLGFG